MRFPRNAKPFTGQINAGPFMSFFFMMLVIFAFNQVLVSTPGVRINLPSTASPQHASYPAVRVAVDYSGQFFYDAQTIDLPTLEERLREVVKQAGSPLTLVLEMDAQTQLRTFGSLQKLASDAGFRELLFETRPALFPAENSGAPAK